MPKVFVSYSHDSDVHKARVKDFVSRLRSQDIRVVCDEDIAKIGGPDEGWPRWCERQIVESDSCWRAVPQCSMSVLMVSNSRIRASALPGRPKQSGNTSIIIQERTEKSER
jgi:hypothetical protein